MNTLELKDLAGLPTVLDIETAGRAFGLSRSNAYRLAKQGSFPCRVIRIGRRYRVPTAEVLTTLGVERRVPS